jgi:tRNA (adenine22-N1)-methyltransferase
MAVSRRLEKVISLIKLNERVIDIGTDHAIVPIELYKRDITSNLTATEVAKGPYDIALKNIKENGLKDKIRLILSDGFENISPRQFDTIVILGMGGSLISKILSPKKTKIRARLILHATNSHDLLRKKVSSLGYEITEEYFIKEGKAENIIIVAERNPFKSRLTKYQRYLGPILMESKDKLVLEYYKKQLTYLEDIYNKSNNKEHLKKIKMLRKVLNNE